MPAPTRSRGVVSGFGHATFRLWFPLFQFLAERLSPEHMARLASASIERVMWDREVVREAVLQNVSAVLGLPVADRRVEETGREVITRHSRLWIDLLHYAGRPREEIDTLLSAHTGTERLVEARSGGRGAILLTAHVGNFELGGLFLRNQGVRVSVVYAQDPSPVVEAYRARARATLGVEGIPVTSPLSFVAVLRALEENSFVAIQGDRDYAGTGRRLPFFGKSASFPVGPFKIAQASRAPLLPVFVLLNDDGTYRTVVEEAIPVEGTGGRGGREAAVEMAMRTFVEILSRTIRESPSQWYCFTPFWGLPG